MTTVNDALLRNNPMWNKQTRAVSVVIPAGGSINLASGVPGGAAPASKSADLGGEFMLLANPPTSPTNLRLMNTYDVDDFPDHGIIVVPGGSFQVALGPGAGVTVRGEVGAAFTVIYFG